MRICCRPGRRRVARHRNREIVAQILRGERTRLAEQALEAAGVDDAAALLAGAEPEIDDLVGDANHVGVVLDDQHRVALIAQLPQDRDQPQVVARVQADRRLVEHVERADQRRAERGGEADALRLAARERRRQPIERQVVEADVVEEAEPPLNLTQHLLGDRRFALRERQLGEERRGFAHRERAEPIDRPAGDEHVARFAAQPRALAVGAGLIAAIAAEEHADVDLVLLPLEPLEEAVDAVEVAAAVQHELALALGQLAPRHVEPHVRGARRALHRAELLRDSAAWSTARSRPAAASSTASGTTSPRSSSITLPKP